MIEKLVSIIIPTYDRPKMLKRTIDSVLNQTYENIEVIIVDDNNPNTSAREETIALMASIDDQRVKYIKHEKNKNGSAARNTGFYASSGDYIMFLDDDDEFYQKKVEEQLNKMETLDSTWGASYTGYVRKLNGKIIARSAETREGNLLIEELSRNLFIHAGSNLMVRRNVVQELKGFDENFLRNQDIEFLVRLLKKYKLGYIDYIGLVVNKDDRKNSRVDFVELTSQYKKKFNIEIANLSTKDKIFFNTHLSLQLFRYFLLKIKLIKAIKIIMINKVKIRIVFKYIVYLVHRKITGKVYGFIINE